MQTVTYKHLIDLFVATTPVTLSSGVLSTDDALGFNRYVNRALRRGWEWYWWPQLMAYEERYYRDNWSAQAYAAADEVRYATNGKYYRANATTTGSDVPGTSSKWDEITSSLDAYVAYEQTGATAFSHVKDVYSADFRNTSPAPRLPWEYDDRGIRLTGRAVPPSAWLMFRKRPYSWRGADYSGSATYAAGDIVYFASGTSTYEGDFWTCVSATSAGQSPSTTAAKWSVNAIPAFLADFAVAAASLGFRLGQQKLDAALLAGEGPIWANLYDERAKLSGGMIRTAAVANLP